MKKLPKKFTKNGWEFNQEYRKGKIAVYSKVNKKLDCKIPSYETIKIHVHNGITLGKNYIPPSEVYPSSSQWGQMGWTYQDLESAIEKAHNIDA